METFTKLLHTLALFLYLCLAKITSGNKIGLGARLWLCFGMNSVLSVCVPVIAENHGAPAVPVDKNVAVKAGLNPRIETEV